VGIVNLVATDPAQDLIEATVLCRMLIETLERADARALATDQFMVELRDLGERAHAHLASLRGPAPAA
jgi:hypothetical protein